MITKSFLVNLQLATDKHEFKMAGPPPARFGVSDGQMFDVATAAVPTLLRLGSGALNYGYKAGLVADDNKWVSLLASDDLLLS